MTLPSAPAFSSAIFRKPRDVPVKLSQTIGEHDREGAGDAARRIHRASS